MTAITSQTFHHAPAFTVPRGARVVAELFIAAARLLARAFSAAPSAASSLRSRAAEAEDVRRLARTWERTDPGFAADLYAAAARHEGQAD
jgi:hypothetical protein